MPSSNLPDPDKIPDMSLDGPSEKPLPSLPKPEEPSAYQPKAEPLKPIPIEPEPPAPSPREWREGDDVFGPWEPTFLYPGVIRQIEIDDARGDQALISYDDGGEGWVFLFSLQPLELKIGEQVQIRHPRGNRYTPAEVVEVNGDDVQIRYDDGGTEWTTIVCMRVPCIANGPGAVQTKLAHWQTPYDGSGAAPPSSGVPSWVWTVGIVLLMMFLRIGCRAMNH